MGCRKNQASLTPAEKTAFVNAVLALKNSVPSQLHPGDPNLHRYDDYVEVHMNAMMLPDGSPRSPGWAHRGPAFFPWHREMLRQFELDLQKIDSTVTLPYWDWTVDQSNTALPWTDDFMGALPPTDKVTTGHFKEGSWVKVVFDPQCTDDNTPYLRRALGRPAFQTDPCGLPNITALPTDAQINDPVVGALTETPYDQPPFGQGTNPSFRDRLEGWHGAGSIHNRVHLWVGGSMLPSTSPNDPIFFLHHCNVDRLWAVWQQQHPGEGYRPTGAPGDVTPNPGHNLNDVMIFNDPGQPAPWSGAATVASVLNHHALGYWYDTDPPEVNLLTPSLAFTDIPEGLGGTGVTTFRAVLFEVKSCADVHLEITAGPTAGFAAPLGLTAVVPATHQDPPAVGRLWVSYTSTTAGSSITGSVTVRVIETGQSWVVNLSANTVPRPKSAVALVLDHSGSMSDDAGDGHAKVEKLRAAVSTFVTVMLPGDGLSIVRFDDTVQRLMDVTDVGPASTVVPGSGRALANAIVTSNQLDPAGATSIGGGVAEGKLALDTAPPTTPPYSVRALLVLTDGLENTPPMIADVSSSITANTFAIGFGTPANISTAALNALTQNHNGYLVVTGAITPDQSLRLAKYFLQILAGVTNANVVLDPQGELVLGAVHRIAFPLTEADMGVDVILLSPAPYLVDFQLETPDGHVITPAQAGVEPAVQYVLRGEVSYYRLSLPALKGAPKGSHTGQWYAILTLGREGRRAGGDLLAQFKGQSLPYNLLVHAYSNLRFRAAVHQRSLEPGAEVEVVTSLTEYEVPVEGRARVWVELTPPEGPGRTLVLKELEAGRFVGQFPATQPGVYRLRIRAAGTTWAGRPFQRELTLTAAVVKGGDQEPRRDRETLDSLRERERRQWPGKVPTAGAAGDLAHLLSLPEIRRALRAIELEAASAEGRTGFAELHKGEPPRRQPEALPHPHGPMFDLSPEDKAAEEAQPGARQGTELYKGEPLRREAEPPSHPQRPLFDLSPEDKAAEQAQPGAGPGHAPPGQSEEPPRKDDSGSKDKS